MRPGGEIAADIAARTDSYFTRTREIVERYGDKAVTYAIFLRRPAICAPRLMTEWVEAAARERGIDIDLTWTHEEGAWIGAGEPLAYLSGGMAHLSEMETILLQKIGPACVAAHNAWQMCLMLPTVAFLAMEARHCAGAEMQDMMAYACSVGSAAAKREGAVGFVGNANDGTAHWFGAARGFGTMPHSLIGYAGSTLRAAEMFHETFPDEPMTVLADYFGHEITDAIAVCARFPDLVEAGRLSFRLDTHGGRFLEGLDPASSYAVLERRARLQRSIFRRPSSGRDGPTWLSGHIFLARTELLPLGRTQRDESAGRLELRLLLDRFDHRPDPNQRCGHRGGLEPVEVHPQLNVTGQRRVRHGRCVHQ